MPYLDCYEDLGGGQYKAHMGFDNLGAIAASLDVGPSNAFNPAPQDRGQVTEFPLGRSSKSRHVHFKMGSLVTPAHRILPCQSVFSRLGRN